MGRHLAFLLSPANCAGTRQLRSAPGAAVGRDDLERIAAVPVDADYPPYRDPLLRDATQLARALGPSDRIVLLGSVAAGKYVDVLLSVLGPQRHVPHAFIGRGAMSRGSLLLRRVEAHEPLAYIPAFGTQLRTRLPDPVHSVGRRRPCVRPGASIGGRQECWHRLPRVNVQRRTCLASQHRPAPSRIIPAAAQRRKRRGTAPLCRGATLGETRRHPLGNSPRVEEVSRASEEADRK